MEAALSSHIASLESAGIMPDRTVMPGIYCSSGRSSCKDPNGSKSCLCPTCPLHLALDLRNAYYCLKGTASEVG